MTRTLSLTVADVSGVKMARIISVQEISKHCLPEDLWTVVDGIVYDMTQFAPEHPGGAGSKPLYNLRRTIY